MNSEKRLESVAKAYELLNKLPSIGQTIGTLNQRMRRCKLDSKKYIFYEQNRDRLITEQSDISYDVRLILVGLLTDEEQMQFIDKGLYRA